MKNQFVNLIEKSEFRRTKYPIILCHGLFGFNKLGLEIFDLGPANLKFLQLKYWRGIEEELQKNGCLVYAAQVGSVSSIQQRANELHQYLETNFKDQRINLIGHSMGGLDIRYLLSHIRNRSYKVESLTTIATPHRGSSFMDWCRDTIGVGQLSAFAARYTDDLVILSFDSLYHENLIYHSKKQRLHKLMSVIDAPAFTNLTREYCQAFNELTTDDPSVYYSSYAAYRELKPTSFLGLAQRIVACEEGMNDGMVSVESAKWGDFLGVVDGSHWDLVPPKISLAKFDTFKRTEFYFTIVTKLAEKGF